MARRLRRPTCTDVLPPYQDRARIGFVQSSRQKSDRALPGAIQAHNGHALARFNTKAHIPQNRSVFVVAKPYRTEFQFGLDVAPKWCHGTRALQFVDRRW